MTKYKASLRIAEEPYRMIKWFTKNFDKEIGALGIGVVEDGEMYIEKLVFPPQIVNGLHVHFKPEDWGPIMMELTPEEISKIIFYWHKHPYSAAASSGDEADTFDVFMPEDTERPYFGFMQTANKNGTGFEYEARIEMRHPIFCSITDVEMFSDVDVDIADACKKIIAEKITEGNASATDQTGSGAKKGDIVTYSNKVSTMPIVIKNEDEYEHVFEVKIKNGSIHLTISNYLEPWILELLGAPPMFDTYKDSVTSYGDELTEIKIKPKKRCGKMIFKFFKSLKDEVCYKEEEETTVEGAVATANQFKTQKDLNNERNNTLGNDETWQNYFPNQ